MMETPDIVALLIVALILFSFWKTHRDPSSSINIFDLVLENGKLSRLSCAFWATFGLLAWIMIKVTQAGDISVEYVGAFGALFVAPIIAKMFSAPPPAGTITTSLESKTEVK